VVDRKWIGGSCHNIAFLRSKNAIYSAKRIRDKALPFESVCLGQ
jgi:hypothetical protein